MPVYLHADLLDSSQSNPSSIPSTNPSAQNNYNNSNVIIAHLREGIEVVHLYSGRTLCRVKLYSSNPAAPSLYKDLNSDNLIDRVQAFPQHAEGGHGAGEEEKIPSCLARVTSGVPVMEELFNSSICGMVGGFFANLVSVKEEGEPIQVTNPIALKRYFINQHDRIIHIAEKYWISNLLYPNLYLSIIGMFRSFPRYLPPQQ